MKIVFKRTKRKDTVELSEFYREAGDPPGSGKRTLCQVIQGLPDTIKFITLDASGGQDEMNSRPRWSRWFTRDKRTFATWTKLQISKWLEEHQVKPEFSQFVLSQPIQESRKWVRILASNEKLVSYYSSIGFKVQQKWLLPSVKMKVARSKIKC
jgi:hypothetical protein